MLTPELEQQVIREIIEPTVRTMRADGTPYSGVLYAGLMLTDDGPAVSEREEAGLLAGHKLLDHDLRPGSPELPAEHLGERALGLGERLGDDHALARREPIGLEHERRLETAEGGVRFGKRGSADIAGGGDAGARAQILGETLAPLQLRRRGTGAEHREASRAQAIRETVHQRRLGTDDHEVDGVLAAERRHRGVILRIEIDQPGMLGDARIAGRGPHRGQLRGVRELPRQRMLSAARPQQKDVHDRRSPRR